MRMRGSVFSVPLSVLLLAGCTGPDKPAWVSFNPNHWADRGQTDEPVVLEVTGPVAVDVESFNGDVFIKADPQLTSATVTVMREAVHGHGRVKEAKASLDNITHEATIVAGDLGQVLQVRTYSTDAEPHFQRAHVFIELPVVEGVRVRTDHGKVNVRGVQGPIDVVSGGGGDVRVMTNLAMTQPVTIVNQNGDINYRVRGESTGRFDAETINGKVHNFARYGSITVSSPTSSDKLNAVLNEGTNPVVLRAVNGDIRIAVVSNPEQVGDYIRD